MNDERDTREERTRRALHALPEVKARPEFRARLKRQFTEGSLAPASGFTLGRRIEAWWRRPLLVTGAAVGAVALLLLAFRWGSPTQNWQVDPAAAEALTRNGSAATKETRFAGGDRIVNQGLTDVVFELPNLVHAQLTPGSTWTLPRRDGFFGLQLARDARYSAHVEQGEVRITTMPRFHGSRLFIRTDEAEIEVTGTTLAVIRQPYGTCTCVLEGTVRMSTDDASWVSVSAGERRTRYIDGKEDLVEPILPMETMKLEMFRDAMGR